MHFQINHAAKIIDNFTKSVPRAIVKAPGITESSKKIIDRYKRE